MSVRLLALALLCGGSRALVQHRQTGKLTPEGKPVCENGLWSEATVEELLTGAKEPNVQARPALAASQRATQLMPPAFVATVRSRTALRALVLDHL